jgi:hypothetical protein
MASKSQMANTIMAVEDGIIDPADEENEWRINLISVLKSELRLLGYEGMHSLNCHVFLFTGRLVDLSNDGNNKGDQEYRQEHDIESEDDNEREVGLCPSTSIQFKSSVRFIL